jgi:hypothetical protein
MSSSSDFTQRKSSYKHELDTNSYGLSHPDLRLWCAECALLLILDSDLALEVPATANLLTQLLIALQRLAVVRANV